MARYLLEKRAVLLIATLAVVSLVLLAGSLGELDFQPGRPLRGESDDIMTESIDLSAAINRVVQIPFWKHVIFWAVLFVLVLLIVSMMSPKWRKRLMMIFLRIAIFALVVIYLIQERPGFIAGILERISLAGAAGMNPQPMTATVPEFTPPQTSGWFSYALTLGIILLVGLFFWWIYRLLQQIGSLKHPHASVREIAGIARASLNDLRSGRNFENSIIECYARMSTALDRRRGLHRDAAMTPLEFAGHLTRAGLPREPVDSLTGLFDLVRYGGQRAGPSEMNEAIQSLTAILHHVGEEA